MDSVPLLSTVAVLARARLEVPSGQALALSPLCSPLVTPCVSGGVDFPQHRN
jgi:hypothetical protein